MAAFYEHLAAEDVATLDALARLLNDLRDGYRQLLAPYAVDDEQALLARIQSRELPEHPAYEVYLGARLIAQTRETLRAELKGYLLNIGSP